MSDPDAPKLIIDTDWKSQAQREKDRLAETDAKARPQTQNAAREPDPRGAGEPRFSDLIRMLATQALLYMGAFPDPETGKAIVALDVAKLHIDLLALLETKTKGNLTAEESALMQRSVSELRLEFVELTRALAKAVEEGRLSPSGGVMPGAPGVAPPGSRPDLRGR